MFPLARGENINRYTASVISIEGPQKISSDKDLGLQGTAPTKRKEWLNGTLPVSKFCNICV